MRGVNEDEVVDLVEFAIEHDAQMRFIEHMPLDIGHTWDRGEMVPREEILAALSGRFRLEPLPGRGGAPAELFSIDGGPFTVGVIASVTAPFCANCDRLRLTADGQLRNCLFAREELDLRTVLRNDASDEGIRDILRAAVAAKRAGHGIDSTDFVQPERGMNAIGG
jgi:cyclic pyranopterin phosphate synthase